MSEAQPSTSTATPAETFCINHPGVATGLRCNKCGSPICVKCAVRTPVGYRCKTCVKTQQQVFYTAKSSDYVIAAVITLPIAVFGQFLIAGFGLLLGFLVLFGAPVIGGLTAELVYRASGKRRGQYTWLVVGACFVIGALPAIGGSLLMFNMYGLLWQVISLVLAVGAAVARLRFGK